jgi:hypothetical protein
MATVGRHHSLRHPMNICIALLLLLSLVLNTWLFLWQSGIFDPPPMLLSPLRSKVKNLTTPRLLDQSPLRAPPTKIAPSQSSIEGTAEVPLVSKGNNVANTTASTSLPLWITEYLIWHQEQRRTLNLQNWREHKYLVVRCLRHDVPCGGLADRLRHVPLALWMAAQTGRLLLIHWELPAPLEEFLVPPTPIHTNNDSDSKINSLDWRIPTWLLDKFQFANRPTVIKVPEIPAALLNNNNISSNNNSNSILMDMRLQSYREAYVYYNTHAVTSKLDPNPNSSKHSSTWTDTTDPDFNAILRPVWNLLFTPSPAVATLLTSHLQRMHLQPGQYAAAHTRTLYHFNLTGSDLQNTVENAVNCAAQLDADSNSNSNAIHTTTGITTTTTPTSILVASDCLGASQLAVAYGQGRVVSQSTTPADDSIHNNSNSAMSAQYQTPLHLDREADFLSRHEQRGVLLQHQTALPAEAYYNVFVDLYLLAMARCVTYDRGGFGKLASLLSTNTSCFIRHKTNKCRPIIYP